jgi:hypothetical protein
MPAVQQGMRSRRIGSAFIGVLVSLVLLGACSSGDDDDPPTEAGDEGAAADGSSTADGGDAGDGGGGGEAAADTLTGLWEGSYECSQGATALRLTVDDRGDGTVGAAFEFEPSTDNPDVRKGEYSMTGNLADGTLVLEPQEWLDQAEGYSMVGLQADVGGGETLEGTVVGDGCTTFSVERTSTDPWYVGAWQGKYGCTQGLTGLTLTIESTGPGQVGATYEFYEVPENPGVPSGSFRMAGTYEAGQLRLDGTEWIEQPPGYGMVGYESNTDLGIDPDRIFGTVTGAPGCNVFEMNRAG